MNRPPEPDYHKIFWRTAIRQMPHHGLLILARKRDGHRLATMLDSRMRKKLNYAAPSQPSAGVLQEYIQAASQASFWHGTGRFQYKHGEVVDTLASIAEIGALTPTRDVYSIVLTGKEMESLSATAVRIIARSYADTHGKGVHEVNRYGSSLWWVAYYYNLCYFEIVTKHGRSMAKNWSAFNRASADTRGERTWGKKVHSKAKSVWDTFGFGSDIPGNYPVLFGIKHTVEKADLPKAVQKWEVRIIKPVALSDISHVEVPEQKVEEVKQLFAKHNHPLPVFPIEIGEYVASKQSLVDLLDTSPKSNIN